MYRLKNNLKVKAVCVHKNAYDIRFRNKVLLKEIDEKTLKILWFEDISKQSYAKAKAILKSLKECADRTRVRPTMVIIDDPVTLTKEQKKHLYIKHHRDNARAFREHYFGHFKSGVTLQNKVHRLYTGPGTFFGIDPAGEGKDVGAITIHHYIGNSKTEEFKEDPVMDIQYKYTEDVDDELKGLLLFIVKVFILFVIFVSAYYGVDFLNNL